MGQIGANLFLPVFHSKLKIELLQAFYFEIHSLRIISNFRFLSQVPVIIQGYLLIICTTSMRNIT